jgi:hypothetical protein
MNINQFELKKSAILFFDILTATITGCCCASAHEALGGQRRAPDESRRAASLPIFAKGNHQRTIQLQRYSYHSNNALKLARRRSDQRENASSAAKSSDPIPELRRARKTITYRNIAGPFHQTLDLALRTAA